MIGDRSYHLMIEMHSFSDSKVSSYMGLPLVTLALVSKAAATKMSHGRKAISNNRRGKCFIRPRQAAFHENIMPLLPSMAVRRGVELGEQQM